MRCWSIFPSATTPAPLTRTRSWSACTGSRERPRALRSSNVLPTLDTLTAEHKMAPTIVVIPRIDTPATLDTECVNGAAGQPQTDRWLAHDLPVWTAGHYRVQAKRTSWVSMGYSYGAWCAASIAMRHPDVFGAAIVMQGYFHPDFSATYDPLSKSSRRGYDLVHLAQTATSRHRDVGAHLSAGLPLLSLDLEVPQRGQAPAQRDGHRAASRWAPVRRLGTLRSGCPDLARADLARVSWLMGADRAGPCVG